MSIWNKRLVIIISMLGLLALTTGCGKAIKWARCKVGLGVSVSDPSPDEPEWVIAEVLKAGAMKSEKKGWKIFKGLLHTDQLNNISLKNWRQFVFKRIRKQWEHYFEDPEVFEFIVDDYQEADDGTLTMYVRSTKTDMPTPCSVKEDVDADGEWKITRCSL